MDEKRQLRDYIKNNKKIENYFGTIDIDDPIGEGGNSVVYSARINNIPIAIKFLVGGNDKQINRYKAEYLNTVYHSDRLVNCINYIYAYEFLIPDTELSVHYILMKKYDSSLAAEIKNSDTTISYEKLKKIFVRLKSAIKSMEECRIIHRDLKPENILTSNGNYFVSDFGCAHYTDPLIDGNTKKDDRLGNYNFSAPEQSVKGATVSNSADLFALGEILYWCVFKTTVRGESGRHITEIYKNDDKEVEYLDRIIHWCIKNDPSQRPQSVEEISKAVDHWMKEDKKIDPYDDMETLSEAVSEIVPEGYNGIFISNNLNLMDDMITNIISKQYKRNLCFNTGKSWGEIRDFRRLKNGNYVLGREELKILRFCLFLSNEYENDIVMFEVEHPDYYCIDGKKCDEKLVIESPIKTEVPAYMTTSGYVRIGGTVYKIADLSYEQIFVKPDSKEKYYFVSPYKACFQISDNDQLLKKFQFQELTRDNILKLRNAVNRDHELLMMS